MSPTTPNVSPLPGMRLGRDVCADWPGCEGLEWLVTNGIGGYASGTVAGMPTRGYHGLLVAAMSPPVGRTVVLAATPERVTAGGVTEAIGALRWQDGTVAPDGRATLESVRLEGTTPVWRYAGARFVLEKRVTMDHGANVVRVDYANLWSEEPVELALEALTDFRDYHGRSFAADWLPAVAADGDTLTVAVDDRAEDRLHIRLAGGTAEAAAAWWRGIDLAQERARGLTDAEDHVRAGTLRVTIPPGATAQFVANVGPTAAVADCSTGPAEAARQARILDGWRRAQGPLAQGAPDWVAQLVLAADQFVARRTLHDGSAGHTVIAGYHWFADWGRDTMISLPGLLIETGRTAVAQSVLRAFADAVDGGMVPNRFPDAGTAPEFNTVDAAFWFIEAVAALDAATGDAAFLAEMFPVLEDIVDRHCAGTRYGIHLDAADGLIAAGEPGVQLTWMDARVGDWVVTPRIGKPVEVNALWISGLRFLADAARRLGRPADRFEGLLAAATKGFARFWNAERGYLFDVLDGPGGHEDVLRPNQIFAARPGVGVLDADRRRQVVRACEGALLTPAGLRSQAPGTPGYIGGYGGDQTRRDGAYHRGTVWTWLIGPFVEAHLAAFGDVARARAILAPMADQLRIQGLGTINEIFEGDAPHAPRGCIAQAWSVGEVLRAWHLIERAERRTGSQKE
ncbi:MAG: amylo-alpha-1,6-glucosidase [Alphaproteobacteria bacterium]